MGRKKKRFHFPGKTRRIASHHLFATKAETSLEIARLQSSKKKKQREKRGNVKVNVYEIRGRAGG